MLGFMIIEVNCQEGYEIIDVFDPILWIFEES